MNTCRKKGSNQKLQKLKKKKCGRIKSKVDYNILRKQGTQDAYEMK